MYTGAGAGGMPPAPSDKALPQFEQNIVPGRFASVLTRDEADALRLPLTLTVRGDSDEAILTDEIGAKALRTLENFGQAFRFRDGRMALPHSLAMDLTRRYGGVLQLRKRLRR